MAVTAVFGNLLRLERRRVPRTSHAWERPVGSFANALAPTWLALNLLDALLTRHGLSTGVAIEMNPLYRALGMGLADAVKAAATVITLVLVWRLRRHSIATASIALVVLCAWVLFVNVWNICHLI